VGDDFLLTKIPIFLLGPGRSNKQPKDSGLHRSLLRVYQRLVQILKLLISYRWQSTFRKCLQTWVVLEGVLKSILWTLVAGEKTVIYLISVK
jgi:hypothetical protein